MAYEKLISLANRLYQESAAGRVNWGSSSDENTFQVSFPKYSIVVARIPDEEHDGAEYIVLRILNQDGQIIEELNQGEAYRENFPNMEELFALARRTAMGVEQALDDLLRNLELGTAAKARH